MENNTFKYKEVSITAKTFTTERKHRKTSIDISWKGSIIKEKCRQLSEIVLDLYPDRRISNDDLAYLVKRYVGADRETLRAYLGYRGFIKRSKRSGEGYVVGNSRKGYLEIFDFMHRVSHNEWVIHAQMKLSNADLEHHINEGLKEKDSKEKISISQRVKDATTSIEAKEIVDREKQYNNNNTERERNFTPKISPKILELTPEETTVLTAKPIDSEPDRSKPIRRVSNE
jgi:hypothetical protein